MRTTRHIATAYHEAGHAVAAAVLGLRFDSVWISGPTGRIDPRRDNGIHWHTVAAVAAGLLQRGILIEAEVLEHFRFP